MLRAMRKLLVMLEMIKIQHSVFALPFAAAAAVAATGGEARWGAFGWILVCMVTARASAMAFNRWADAGIDAANPRTAVRAIPKGEVSRVGALVFAAVCAGGFVAAAGMLNRVTLQLAPVALVVTLGYSYTKRFTALCHFVLGVSLAMAPVGAWLGIRAGIGVLPVALGVGVMFWTAGFDILYACQDVDFDRRAGLRSMPVALGVPGALRLAAVLHGLAVLAFAAPLVWCGYGGWYGAGVGGIALLLVWEHRLVRPDDLARVNRAFFHVNAVVAVVLMAAVMAEVWIGG